jgi:hypothetical protein
MDSIEARLSDTNFWLLDGSNIIALVVPVPTINPFQAPDLVFFDAINNNKDSRVNEQDVPSIHGEIWNFVRAAQQTMTSFTIRSCFRRRALSPDAPKVPFRLEADGQALAQNDRLKELRGLNVSIDEWRSRPRLHK